MKRSFAVSLVLAIASCRGYHLDSRVTDQDGLIPPDRFARYGHEQAEAMAIAREFGHARQGSSPEALRRQADSAISYAKTLPDVADVRADPEGLLLTIRFKSGWRTMVPPIENGKRGAETVGLPAKTGSSASH
jgi:hypothetical protein